MLARVVVKPLRAVANSNSLLSAYSIGQVPALSVQGPDALDLVGLVADAHA